MQTTVIPFALHSYQSRSLPWAAQRCVNWRPQTAPPQEMTKSPVALVPRYAKERWGTLSGECRGLHRMGDVLYAVYGNTLYTVDSTGAETARGTIPVLGSNPVTFADNGTLLRFSAGGKGYLWDGTTLSIVVADSTSVAFLNGYFVDSVSDGTGEFVWSQINDPDTIDPLDFATAESDGDYNRRVIEHQQELWIFGQDSAEVWVTTGNPDSAFQRLPSANIEYGTAARHSICRASNSLFWVANDRTVRRNAGYTPQRVSTDWIDSVLVDHSLDLEDVRGFSHVEDGHTFYTITLPGEWTFSLNINTGIWQERSTFPADWWNAFSAVDVYGYWVVGDNDGGLFRLKPNLYKDDDGTISLRAVSAPLFRSSARIAMPRLFIDVQAGVGLTTGQGSDPQIMLRWSDDGGHNWSNEHWRSLGAIGQTQQRVVFRQLGQFYSRIFELVVTDPVRAIILGVYADIDILPP